MSRFPCFVVGAAAVVGTTTTIAVAVYFCSLYVTRLPKGLKKIPKSCGNAIKNVTRSSAVSPNGDRFSEKKIPQDLDAIVIGSGIGGLAAAAFLSKVGWKVLVLEQHYVAGGCTHTFVDKGYEFETGIHYVGNIAKRLPVLNMITDKPITWQKLGSENPDEMVYDEVWLGKNHKFKFRSGTDNFLNDLIKLYPEEKDFLKQYVKLVQETAEKSLFFNLKLIQCSFIRRIVQFFCCREFFKTAFKTTLEVLNEMTSNQELISVLCSQWGDVGRPPSQTSFFMHASVVNHYLEGAFFPIGGPAVIANSVIPVIEKSGGRVLVGVRVSRVLVNERQQVVGVEIKDEEKGTILNILAPIVISNVGIVNTYSRLLEPSVAKPYNLDGVIKRVGVSKTQVFLFVGLRGTSEELGLQSGNIWIWPNHNFDTMQENFESDPMKAEIPLFVASGSAKDPDYNNRYPGKSTAMLISFALLEWFQKWESEQCKNRGEDYNDLKEMFAKRMFEEGLFRIYPHLRDKVEYYSVATPLSVQSYIASKDGEVYGLDSVPNRFKEDFTPYTHVKGLYLAGQDITTLGFTGSLMSGLLCAHAILGYGNFCDFLSGRNLFDDLLKFEKA